LRLFSIKKKWADSIFNNIECRYLSQKEKTKKYTGKTYRYDRATTFRAHGMYPAETVSMQLFFAMRVSTIITKKTSEAAASDSTSKRCLRNLAMPNTGLAVQLNHTKNWPEKDPKYLLFKAVKEKPCFQ